MDRLFSLCHAVNDLLLAGKESDARNELIKMLEEVEHDGLAYSPLINNLIRSVGLFPYLDPETSSWQERYVFEAFKVDIGNDEPITLHREQSRLLSSLLDGKSIAVSAPTSFGKSFVIDSFIAIKKPINTVILVPTIALADETRRRLQKKFGLKYKIITTPDQSLSERNIFVFPQERAVGYFEELKNIDILVVDEFYKASKFFDKERAPALIRAIARLGKIAKQRYFLAPNIHTLQDSPFTENMEFLHLDFNTVFLEKNELYEDIGKDEQKKSAALLRILDSNKGKTLIYAGTYSNIKKISNLLMDSLGAHENALLNNFQQWLALHYDPNWELTKLVVKGVGIHNGQLHRSLSQLEIKLFEEENGLDCLISTSSIIEGVNTSAQNVIVWSNKNGKAKINDFTYKNIIGRGGRMFRHFVGKIFILEPPPAEQETQLDLELPDELVGSVDIDSYGVEYTPEQQEYFDEYKSDMIDLVGSENYNYFVEHDVFQTSNSSLVRNIAREIKGNDKSWNGLIYLNSSDPNDWERMLYKIIRLDPGAWEIQWSKYVEFVKVLANNWSRSIPEMLDSLGKFDIGIDEFFKLERNTTFKLSSLVGDVNVIYNSLRPNEQIDLGPAISRMSHAFLPPVVHQLEEYGLPRMISRKLQSAGIVDFEDVGDDVHTMIEILKAIGIDGLVHMVGDLDDFDIYILEYFFSGIE